MRRQWNKKEPRINRLIGLYDDDDDAHDDDDDDDMIEHYIYIYLYVQPVYV